MTDVAPTRIRRRVRRAGVSSDLVLRVVVLVVVLLPVVAVLGDTRRALVLPGAGPRQHRSLGA